MTTFGLDVNGLVLPRQADFITSIKTRYTELTGERPDWDRDEVLGSLLAVVTLELDELSQFVQSVYDAWDENNATGVQLENLAGIFPGISKKIATSSVVVLTMTGTPGTVVPAGYLVEGGGTDGLARWKLRDGFTLPVGGVLDDVLADAVETGPIQAQPGEVDKIVNLVAGWDLVKNADVATPGMNKENDDGLRKRRRESLQIVGGRSLGAILGNILALPFIVDALVIENTDNLAQTVQGILLPPHSLAAIVLPDPLTADQQESLAKVIYNVVPVGIEIFGTETALVTGADGLDKIVAWNHPAAVLVTAQWAVRPEPGFAFSKIKTGIQDATITYFETLGVGEPVRRLALVKFICDRVDGIQQIVVLLNLLPFDVEPDANQVATFSTAGSTVVQA